MARQTRDRGAENSHGLFAGELPFRRQLEHGEIQLRHGRQVRTSTALPQAIDRQIGGGLEEKGSQETDRCRVIELQQMNVRFLCDFPRFLFRADLGRDEAQQRGIVLTEQPLDIDGLGIRDRGGW